MNPISFGLTLGSLTVKQAAAPGIASVPNPEPPAPKPIFRPPSLGQRGANRVARGLPPQSPAIPPDPDGQFGWLTRKPPPPTAADRANWMQPEEFDDRHLDRGFVPPKPTPPKPVPPKPVPPTFAQTAGSVIKNTAGNMANAGANIAAPGTGGAALASVRRYFGF